MNSRMDRIDPDPNLDPGDPTLALLASGCGSSKGNAGPEV